MQRKAQSLSHCSSVCEFPVCLSSNIIYRRDLRSSTTIDLAVQEPDILK